MENEINTTQTSVLRLSPDMPISEMMHAVSVDSAEFEIPVDATVDEFMHSGVKGMKWGVRRYQNKDGTLTAAGKKREASERKSGSKKGSGALKKAGKKLVKNIKDRKAAKDKEKAEEKLNKQKAKSRKKNVKDMTDDELKDYIERKKLERDAAAVDDQIATSKSHARSVSGQSDGQAPGGNKLGRALVDDVVVPAATTAGKAALTSLLTKTLSKSLGLDGDDDSALALLKKTAEEAGFQKTIAEARKATAEAIKKERENANDARRDAERAAQERVKQEAYTNPTKTASNSDPYRYTSKDLTNRGMDVVSSNSSSPASSVTGNGGYLTAGRSAVAGYLTAPKDDD